MLEVRDLTAPEFPLGGFASEYQLEMLILRGISRNVLEFVVLEKNFPGGQRGKKQLDLNLSEVIMRH